MIMLAILIFIVTLELASAFTYGIKFKWNDSKLMKLMETGSPTGDIPLWSPYSFAVFWNPPSILNGMHIMMDNGKFLTDEDYYRVIWFSPLHRQIRRQIKKG